MEKPSNRRKKPGKKKKKRSSQRRSYEYQEIDDSMDESQKALVMWRNHGGEPPASQPPEAKTGGKVLPMYQVHHAIYRKKLESVEVTWPNLHLPLLRHVRDTLASGRYVAGVQSVTWVIGCHDRQIPWIPQHYPEQCTDMPDRCLIPFSCNCSGS